MKTCKNAKKAWLTIVVFLAWFGSFGMVEISLPETIKYPADALVINLNSILPTDKEVGIQVQLFDESGIEILNAKSKNGVNSNRSLSTKDFDILKGNEAVYNRLDDGAYTLHCKVNNKANGIPISSKLTKYIVSITEEISKAKTVLTDNIKITGSGSISSQLADAKGYLSEVPQDYLRADLRPTLSVFTVPIGMDAIYSTESDPTRQSMNQINFHFDAQQFSQNLQEQSAEKIRGLNATGNLETIQKIEGLKAGKMLDKQNALEKLKSKKSMADFDSKLQEIEGLDKLLQSSDFSEGLEDLEQLKTSTGVQSREDLEKKSNDISAEEYEKLQKLFELENQYNKLKKQKKKLDKWEAKHTKALALKKDLDAMESNDLSSFLSDPKNLKSGMKALGDWKGVAKLMSSFETISIGTSYPVFSELTLSGAKVNGFNIEMNPGLFYLNVCKGKSAARVTDTLTGFINYSFEQELDAIKMGIGKKDASHFFITAMRFEDEDVQRIDTVNNVPLTPTENYIVGTDVVLSLFGEALKVGGEANLSLLNRDKNAGGAIFPMDSSVTDIAPAFVLDRLNASSSIGYAVSGYSTLSMFNGATVLDGKLTQVGPGYFTNGNTAILNDLRKVNIKLNQNLVKDKLSINAFYNENENALVPSASLTRNTFSNYGAGVQLNTTKFFLIANYSPNYQVNKSLETNQSSSTKSALIQGQMGVSLKFGENGLSNTQFGYLQQLASSSNGGVNYSTNFFNASEMISVRSYGIQVSLGYAPKQNDGSTSSNIKTLDAAAFASIFKKVRTSIGYQYFNTSGVNQRSGGYVQVDWPITSWLTFESKALQINYSDYNVSTNSFNHLFINSGLTFNW
jgi:hypothetical protein